MMWQGCISILESLWGDFYAQNTKSLVFSLLVSACLHMSTYQALIALTKICIALSGVKYSLKGCSNLARGSNIAPCFHGTDVILITRPQSIVAKCSRGVSALEELFPLSMTETKLPCPASKLWAEQVCKAWLVTFTVYTAPV